VCAEQNPNTPCFLTTTPKNKDYYNLTESGYICKYKAPQTTAYENSLIDIYHKSSGARDGMSGGLQYNVLLDIAKAHGITDFDDLMIFTNECENILRKNRENKK